MNQMEKIDWLEWWEEKDKMPIEIIMEWALKPLQNSGEEIILLSAKFSWNPYFS